MATGTCTYRTSTVRPWPMILTVRCARREEMDHETERELEGLRATVKKLKSKLKSTKGQTIDPNWCDEGKPGVCEDLRKMRNSLVAIKTWAQAHGEIEVERIAKLALEK